MAETKNPALCPGLVYLYVKESLPAYHRNIALDSLFKSEDSVSGHPDICISLGVLVSDPAIPFVINPVGLKYFLAPSVEDIKLIIGDFIDTEFYLIDRAEGAIKIEGLVRYTGGICL